VEFLSYEGTMTAVGGPANGLSSTGVPVSESGGAPAGRSLQLGGTGAQSSDFTWEPEQAETPGLQNVHQTFAAVQCQTDLGFGNHPSATLEACGAGLATGQVTTLSLEGLPAAAMPFLVAALQSNPTVVFDLDGATLVPLPILLFLPVPNPGTGSLAFPVPGGNGPLSVFVQFILSEPGGITTTNAVRL